MMTEKILNQLKDLDKELFDVHTIDEAWYSTKSIVRAFSKTSAEEFEKLPSVKCVRIGLEKKGGMLELAEENGNVRVRCYCCFGGDPDKGIVPIDQLKEKIESLVDHHCPPWPG